jgi:hypothetical protein
MLAPPSLRAGALGHGVLARSIGDHAGGARPRHPRSRELTPCTPSCQRRERGEEAERGGGVGGGESQHAVLGDESRADLHGME